MRYITAAAAFAALLMGPSASALEVCISTKGKIRVREFIGQLQEANLLFKVVQKVATTDLSPKAISSKSWRGS